MVHRVYKEIHNLSVVLKFHEGEGQLGKTRLKRYLRTGDNEK